MLNQDPTTSTSEAANPETPAQQQQQPPQQQPPQQPPQQAQQQEQPQQSQQQQQSQEQQLPDGVDPSFLAALPEDMRDEVIAEQLRYFLRSSSIQFKKNEAKNCFIRS